MNQTEAIATLRAALAQITRYSHAEQMRAIASDALDKTRADTPAPSSESVAWMVPHRLTFKGARTSCPSNLIPELEGTVAWGVELCSDRDSVTDKFGIEHKARPLVFGDESPAVVAAPDQTVATGPGIRIDATPTAEDVAAVIAQHMGAIDLGSPRYADELGTYEDVADETAAIASAVKLLSGVISGCPLKDSLKVYAAAELAYKYGDKQYVEEVFAEVGYVLSLDAGKGKAE